jgi:catechol 2,3-dioxygenase-like lactoylglutathione lyase family enzyme
MAFYTGKLGFREMFRGGPNDEIRWINLAITGTPGDILELMIMASQPPQGRRHIAFEVPNMGHAYQELLARGLPANSKPNEGPKQNPRWILNLRDPNGVRVEIMGEMVAQK